MKNILILFLIFTANIYGQNNFNSFLNKFCTDTVYQINHVKFPLKKEVLNDETFDPETVIIQKSSFTFLDEKFFLNFREAYPLIFDNFDLNESDSNERVFQWKGQNAMDLRYYFKKIDNEWYLVKISNLGT